MAPSSMRISEWLEVDGSKKPLPKMWEYLADLKDPVIIRGKENVVNTPDQSSGGYYSYGLNRTFIMFKHKTNNAFISVSRQADVSNVGKRGFTLGSDDDWNYLYSDKKGLPKLGLNWVKSYIYDSNMVAVIYETESGPTRWGIFKWMKAGWMKANVVKKKHIYKGIDRYAKTIKKLIEHPLLPGVPELVAVFSDIKKLSGEALKTKISLYLKNLEQKYGKDKASRKKLSKGMKNRDAYLSKMTKPEMRSILMIEYMKKILKKTKF